MLLQIAKFFVTCIAVTHVRVDYSMYVSYSWRRAVEAKVNLLIDIMELMDCVNDDRWCDKMAIDFVRITS